MPNSSERARLICDLDHLIWVHAIDARVGSEEDASSKRVDELLEIRFGITESRYLHPRNIVWSKASLADQVLDYTDRQFKQEVRMDKAYFRSIVRILAAHPVFSNASRVPQIPVWIQCHIVFRRLGCYGNGNSLGMNGRTYGFSEGAVVLFSSRVLMALFSIRKTLVKWPDAAERIQIKSRIKHRFGINGAVGIIDGTPVIFSQKPAIDGETYFSRKGIYCINLQLVCDDRGLIRHYLTGWPGSVYDNTVFEKTKLYRDTFLLRNSF